MRSRIETHEAWSADPKILRRLERVAEGIDRMAPDLLGPADAHGADLASRVARLSALYVRGREDIAQVPHRRDLTAARLRFQLARDVPKWLGPLDELARAGVAPSANRWRVLDLGAGLGAGSLGAALFAAGRPGAESIEVEALDADPEMLRLFRGLAAGATDFGLPPMRVNTHLGDLRDARLHLPEGPFDLVLLGSVVNELVAADGRPGDALTDTISLFQRLAPVLAPAGAIVVVEPGLRATSRFLQRLRDHIAEADGPLHVFGPCLTNGPCPLLQRERDWCHESRAYALPEPIASIARNAGLRAARLTYSYLTLRRDRCSLRDVVRHTTDEAYRIVGGPRRTKGKIEFLGCGDNGLLEASRLNRHRSAVNEALDQARRGDLLTISSPPPASPKLRIEPTTCVSVVR